MRTVAAVGIVLIAGSLGFRTARGGEPLTISLSDTTVTEGADGNETIALVTATLSAPAGPGGVSFAFETALDESAEHYANQFGDNDFWDVNPEEVEIAEGETQTTFDAAIVGDDDDDEYAESFLVKIIGINGASVVDGAAVVTIVDDDASWIYVSGGEVDEGNPPDANIGYFTVSISTVQAADVTMSYEVIGSGAVAGEDFAATSGTLTIPAGQPSAGVSVPVIADLVREEGREWLFLELTNFSPADIYRQECQCQDFDIIDDDGDESGPAITIATPADGATYAVNQPIIVDFSCTDPSGVEQCEGDLDDGATLPTDEIGEFDFDVDATDSRGFTSTKSVTYFVTEPQLTITDVKAKEGNKSTTKEFVFTVTSSVPALDGLPITVDYKTVDGTAKSTKNDFAATNGELTFAPSEDTKTVTVVVNGDNKVEASEKFSVKLSNPVNAVVLDEKGAGTIRNDDR